MKLNNLVKEISLNTIFGKLIVINSIPSMTLSKTSRAQFEVKCECGLEFKAIGTNLRNGVTTSCKKCSFKNRELNKSTKVSQIEQLYNHNIVIRCKDSKKEIINNLSLTDFEVLIFQNCYYCGDKPKPSLRFKNRKYLNSETILINGIDRIDSDLGYSIENCVPCCTTCNKMKMDLKQNEFILKIEKIMNNLKIRNH